MTIMIMEVMVIIRVMMMMMMMGMIDNDDDIEIIYKSYLQNILSHIADTMLQEILKDSEIGVDNREMTKESDS